MPPGLFWSSWTASLPCRSGGVASPSTIRTGCELKWDGFRTLAHVTGGGSKLVSRNGNAFRNFPDPAAELALEVNADDAILDGEIVKLDTDGRPQFHDLMRVAGRSPWSLSTF